MEMLGTVTMKALTNKQELFAQAVGSEGKTNADAYRANYKTDGWTNQAISEAASRVAANSKVAARIMELQKLKRDVANTALSFTVKTLLEKYFLIAFTDPNELISVRTGACRHCWGIDGAYQWKEHEYLDALVKWDRRPTKQADDPMPDLAGGYGYMFTREPNPECVECEGEGIERVAVRDTTKLSPGAKLLYRGAQRTKDGLKILFADQDKALDQLGRMLGAFDDRLRIDLQAEVKALQLTTTDPVEAARAYQQMITGR